MNTTYDLISRLIQEVSTLRTQAKQNKKTISSLTEAHRNDVDKILRLQQIILDRDEALNVLRYTITMEG